MIRKRRPSTAPGRPYVRVPIAEPISVERAVEEGLLIARSALTMEVKNRIIVSALRDDHQFDAAETASWVALELASLAREQADQATRVNDLAMSVTEKRAKAMKGHDYGPRDYSILTLRGMAYHALSVDLEKLVDDEDFVNGVVEDARGRAWAELGTAIESRLDLVPAEIAEGPDYAEGREERIRTLLEVDLANLSALSGY